MKKVLAFALCLCLMVSFAACGKQKKEKSGSSIDLEYYTSLGKIPEVEFSLGENPDKIDERLLGILEDQQPTEDQDHNHDHNEEEFYYEYVEGDNNVLLNNGTVEYYYNKANKKNGIAYIVNYETSFGFKKGTVSVEIKKALSNYKLKEQEVSDENAFFATYISDGSVLEAKINNIVVLFVFQNNELYATAIYDANNWSF